MEAGRIDLERARREAKRLWGTRGALRRGASSSRTRSSPSRGEFGEASWPRLVHRAEAEAVAREDRARRLVAEATDGRRDHAEVAARARSGARPHGLDAALVLGEVVRVRAALARDVGAAIRPVGARDWLPLLYVAHSAFLGGERTDGFLACARTLLDAGADPDSSWEHPEFGALGALYGAAGVAHEPRMTALLLAAGANPDDDESVYHATETSDHTCLRLLLDAGARVEGTNALAHALDTEDPAKVRLLLEHDAGSEVARLAAVGDLPRPLAGGPPPARRARRGHQRGRRGQPALAVRARLAHGPSRPLRAARRAGRAARGRADRRADRALLRRRPRRCAAARGASTPSAPSGCGRVLRGAPPGRGGGPRARGRVPARARRPARPPGQMGGTPLHHSAWWGHGDVVALLLERGADPHRRNNFGGADAARPLRPTAPSTPPARSPEAAPITAGSPSYWWRPARRWSRT